MVLKGWSLEQQHRLETSALSQKLDGLEQQLGFHQPSCDCAQSSFSSASIEAKRPYFGSRVTLHSGVTGPGFISWPSYLPDVLNLFVPQFPYNNQMW